MFNFNNVVKFENKRFDVFAIGELLVDMISDDYDPSTHKGYIWWYLV